MFGLNLKLKIPVWDYALFSLLYPLPRSLCLSVRLTVCLSLSLPPVALYTFPFIYLAQEAVFIQKLRQTDPCSAQH